MSETMVDAAPAREHVRDLVARGMTQQAICRAASVTQAALSALLHGQYEAGRPPQKTIYALTADRLLAVEFEAPAPRRNGEPLCVPGDRFEPVGHRVGRCLDCGQVAPVQTRDGAAQMLRHPRPAPDDAGPGELPQAVKQRHRDCGTPRGHSRHRREKTPVCDLCRVARNSYDQGLEVGVARGRRMAEGAVPRPLAEAVVKAMRAFLYRRPYPQLRELAAAVVRTADAELVADDKAAA